MGSDAPLGRYEKPQGFSVSLQVSKPEEADRAFEALSKGGTVRMPIQKNLLCRPFRYARRSVWRALDDQLPA